MPELELWQSPDKRSELLVLLRGQGWLRGVAIFNSFVLCEGRVEFGLEEGEEKVQKIDSQGVAD